MKLQANTVELRRVNMAKVYENKWVREIVSLQHGDGS